MDIKEFHFDLPESLIAQEPLSKRSDSRLLVLNKTDGSFFDEKFSNLFKYLKAGDVIVRNNTKVLPARLFGVKAETNALVEVLLLKQVETGWECLVGNARVVKKDTVVSFGDGKLKARCLEVLEHGRRVFEMEYQGIFLNVLEELGEMPLPPYIKKQLQDNDRYQTIYAKNLGSSAAPTAGLHFTEQIFQDLKKQGIKIIDLTLHVGLGTFKPIKTSDITSHKMHGEYYQLDGNSATILNEARANNSRIIAIGTTTTRALETIYQKYRRFQADSGITEIFIYPGIKIEAINGLLTNFHLPNSTLILMVSAFASKDYILRAYQYAINEKYRFFSFGDAMLII